MVDQMVGVWVADLAALRVEVKVASKAVPMECTMVENLVVSLVASKAGPWGCEWADLLVVLKVADLVALLAFEWVDYSVD